ncbi:MAG TPA: nuclear transport factor 2 family protein [Caulobacteraceae bacterium]|nr:nuclear transport factor 2 family protein [Caulobacteraceae bacterium]
MSELSPKQVVLNAWAAFASRDPQAVAAQFTDDAEWIAPEGNATAIALGGPSRLTGPGRLATFITEWVPSLFADTKIDFQRVLECGNTVVIELAYRAQLINGRAYDNRYCFLFDVEDGRIARVTEHMDTLAGHRQIFGDEPPRKIA